MKKIFSIAISLAATTAMAQETYEGAQIATPDLNGTARYVGMGGAMEALGADISTINTNPAGLGLFRRSWIGISAGMTSQSGSHDGALTNNSLGSSGTTNADLNQLGFVWSLASGANSRINLAFNYQKSRNFNQVIQAVNALPLNNYGASATKVNAMKVWADSPSYTLQDEMVDEVINLPLGGTLIDPAFSAAEDYTSETRNEGYISNFDFNISGSINDRVYLGFTIGIKDVHYNSYSNYTESLVDINNNPRGTFNFTDDRRVTGTGIDVKFGAIFRPVEESPFRLGLYINTPTWYELKCTSDMIASNSGISAKGNNNPYGQWFSYKYCINTPWRFGLSLGHTIGNKIALGATYEYADYSAIKNKIVVGSYYNYYGDESLETTKDNAMNANTEQALKGVSTLKLGVEVKPVPDIAIRVGYNYQGAIYNEKGYKFPTINTDIEYGSAGAYYSTYDFINWKATNRITFGLGFNLGHNVGLDIAYQYATQKGEYYPFASGNVNYDYTDENGNTTNNYDENVGTGTTVHNNRHQFNVTLGYRF